MLRIVRVPLPDDPDLGIDWRIPADRVILSEKDSRHPRLKDLNL